MKQLTLVIALIINIFICESSFAQLCPSANPSSNFVHTVAPGVLGQPWQMNISFFSLGWSIVDSPLANNSNATYIASNAPLTVILSRVSGNTSAFQFMCQYQLQGGAYPINVTLINSHIYQYSAPYNNHFTKINDNQYACTSNASNPGYCAEEDIHPVICYMGQPCHQ